MTVQSEAYGMKATENMNLVLSYQTGF